MKIGLISERHTVVDGSPDSSELLNGGIVFAMMRRLLDDIEFPGFIVSSEGRLFHCNKELERLCGLTREQLMSLGAGAAEALTSAAVEGWKSGKFHGANSKSEFPRGEVNLWERSVTEYLDVGLSELVEARAKICVLCQAGEERRRAEVLADGLLGLVCNRPEARPRQSKLTHKQRRVHQLLLQGRSYKEIAAGLGVAHATIRVQVATIRQILGEDAIPLRRKRGPTEAAGKF